MTKKIELCEVFYPMSRDDQWCKSAVATELDATILAYDQCDSIIHMYFNIGNRPFGLSISKRVKTKCGVVRKKNGMSTSKLCKDALKNCQVSYNFLVTDFKADEAYRYVYRNHLRKFPTASEILLAMGKR